MLNPNGEGLCEWCERPGMAVICPTCKAGYCSTKCLTDHVKTHPRVRTPKDRLVEGLVVGFGVVLRWAFFIGVGVALIVYVDEADWSAFHTRFADLTIARLAETLARAFLVALMALVFGKWAFRSGKKQYAFWAVLVFYGSVGLLLLYVGLRQMFR
jgi:hypothetical protein